MLGWAEVFVALFASHHVGDYLLQTEWQALNKVGGLGRDPIARRALLMHIATYTAAFVPALVWLGSELGAIVVGIAALVSIPHLIQDDGRLLTRYIRAVKHLESRPGDSIFALVDQSMHLVTLALVALLAHAVS
jgi:Protein of unknown function (DUF3307)